MTHAAYREKQNGIYANIENAGAGLGTTDTTQSDVKEPQGAYLVAWRHPESITSPVEDISLAVGNLATAITYDRDSLHTTVSDYGPAPNLIIRPQDNVDQEIILATLAESVKQGLDNAGRRAIAERAIAYDRFITNGKSVIAPGQANGEALDIRQAILDASIGTSVELKGSWGNHMTVNRFTSESSLGAAARILGLLRDAPTIGESRPTSIDVGYLSVDKDRFTYTTHERFPLDRE